MAAAALAQSPALAAAAMPLDAGVVAGAPPAPASLVAAPTPAPAPAPAGGSSPVAAPAAPATSAPVAVPAGTVPAPAVAAVTTAPPADGDGSGGEEFDFPYDAWTQQINANAATAVHTDEGTTLASGADALVIGADGYDDDDNRATGENITITRDDGNVVIGGVGNVNSQIGDSEQGAVIMDVTRTYIQGGGAY
jgi:hypothetical protein